LVGQTGTSQNAQVKQIELSRVQDQTNDKTMMRLCIKVNTRANYSGVFSGVNILQLKTRQI
jgi:hypothetical protein